MSMSVIAFILVFAIPPNVVMIILILNTACIFARIFLEVKWLCFLVSIFLGDITTFLIGFFVHYGLLCDSLINILYKNLILVLL